MNTFITGQRWYSDTEPELGLGIIEALEHRHVRVYFPAVEEHRIYAGEDAPLTRVRFLPHEKITDRHGSVLHITSVEEANGLLQYSGHNDQGKSWQLPEQDLDARLQLTRPQDRLFSGQIDNPGMYQLRHTTREMQNRLLPNPAWGLSGCRVDLIPHQLYIGHEVASRPRPRVLLADEVGLGKTIEAGLIIHKQILDERVSRILIIVPESLLHQWLVEMLRRFNLRFSLLDEDRCRALSEQQNNPFESEQLVLCSLEMFMHSELRRQQVTQADWDLLVVDEAHHLDWSPQQASAEYQFVQQLSNLAPGVLLLTATPEQLGAAGHFARLHLLDPDRFYDLDEFLEEEELYQPVIRAVDDLLGGNTISGSTREAMQLALGQHPTFDSLLTRIENPRLDDNERNKARQQLIHLLVDRHGTSRVLFRNTRAAISGFPERRPHGVALPLPSQYVVLYSHEFTTEISRALLLTPERLWQQEAENDAALHNWTTFDPRVNWLVETLRQLRGEKILVICAHAQTALELDTLLRERTGIRSTVFHEGMSILERDRAAAYFASTEQGAQLLICSEIGSEGRNFQFAHHLVMFDLPLNPDLLEQRIGRLDRIGQQYPVEIHIPYFEHSPQQVLYCLYQDSLDAFTHPCPAGPAVFDKFSKPIETLLGKQYNDSDLLVSVIDETRQYYQQLAQRLEQGRDRLLELNSYRVSEADYIRQAILNLENDSRLVDYLESASNQFGVEFESHGDNSYVMHPSDHMLVHHFPELPTDGLTLTFSRQAALSREDWLFMSWEHPMIRGVMDLVLENQHGNTAFAVIKHADYQTGATLLECSFVIEGIAPPRLQLHQYLPPTMLRIVIDNRHRDCTEKFPFDDIVILPADLGRDTIRQIIQARQNDLKRMLEIAEEEVGQMAKEVTAKAVDRMQHRLDNEIARLQHLASINPNVRQSEIDQLIEQREQLAQHMLQMQPSLDAVRVFIAS